MNTAVVTGAGRGLGQHIAAGLAERGYSVLVTDIDELAAAETARRIGASAWSMRHDVREPETHRAVARAAAERGTLAVWVNNAGVLHTGASWELTDEVVRQQVDINVLGVMWGSHAAIENMTEGHIINIASMSSLAPTPGLAVYGATKHAVLGFSMSLQGDLHHAGRPIRVSAICPDGIDTDMVRNVAHDEGSSLIFSSPSLLTPQETARRVMSLLDRPRLVTAVPRYKALLTHLIRPFPGVGLRLIETMRKLGESQRSRRS